MLKALDGGDWVVVLDERGRTVTSEDIARLIAAAGVTGWQGTEQAGCKHVGTRCMTAFMSVCAVSWHNGLDRRGMNCHTGMQKIMMLMMQVTEDRHLPFVLAGLLVMVTR